jgi:ligand-binding SRPBCC domain-containing protein
MPILRLRTFISAPRERVFDLARSIEAHQHSTGKSQERAVAGVTTGLIGLNDEVTWEAKHFGLRQRLSVRITRMERPHRFEDVMIAGAFKSMKHIHEFAETPEGTWMEDHFEFQSPLGFLGRLADGVFLAGYMNRFLEERNAVLKQLAESKEWKRFIPKER